MATLTTMLESIIRAVDDTFSWRVLKWRWEAFRSGKPFAEIVLLNTLKYRVEQVFLIHRNTGLLLQHVSVLAEHRDANLVSAMLTAIRDFASDSFGGDESVEAIRVGDLAVWIEQGPHAVLAAVVRGSLPPDARVTFQHALEAIHVEHGQDLESFNGETTPFERARHVLETCLMSQYRQRGDASRAHWPLLA